MTAGDPAARRQRQHGRPGRRHRAAQRRPVDAGRARAAAPPGARRLHRRRRTRSAWTSAAARCCRTWRASAASTRWPRTGSTDEALVTVATMLRMFHDAQYGFRPPPGAVWRSFGPPPPDTEVICHHDAAPHNVIWRPDGTLALIDFDLASPGARIYDVAYAAWTWVPLFTDRDSYTLGWKRPEPAAPAAAVRRRVRADPAGPAPAGADHPQADRRPRRGHPADGRGRRPGVRPDRAQGTPAPPDARPAAARLRAAHPGVRPALIRPLTRSPKIVGPAIHPSSGHFRHGRL